MRIEHGKMRMSVWCTYLVSEKQLQHLGLFSSLPYTCRCQEWNYMRLKPLAGSHWLEQCLDDEAKLKGGSILINSQEYIYTEN
jgi:hypothetical protein